MPGYCEHRSRCMKIYPTRLHATPYDVCCICMGDSFPDFCCAAPRAVMLSQSVCMRLLLQVFQGCLELLWKRRHDAEFFPIPAKQPRTSQHASTFCTRQGHLHPMQHPACYHHITTCYTSQTFGSYCIISRNSEVTNLIRAYVRHSCRAAAERQAMAVQK